MIKGKNNWQRRKGGLHLQFRAKNGLSDSCFATRQVSISKTQSYV
jgi:hypothetical protein